MRAAAAGACLALAGLARANVGYFAGSGHDIVLASTAEVQMVSEDVTIDAGPTAASYLCRFELRNLTDGVVELQAGFPLDGDWFDGWSHRLAEDGHVEQDSCDVPEVEMVMERYRFMARDADTTYHVRYVRHDAERRFRHLFLWSMRFEPGATRTLHVSYDVPLSSTLWSTSRTDWELMTRQRAGELHKNELASLAEDDLVWLRLGALNWISYVTETGASWAGEIESADFHLRTHEADAFLPEVLAAAFDHAPGFDVPDQPPRPRLGSTHVWFGMAPGGWTIPLDTRNGDVLRRLNPDWQPSPMMHAWDWHAAPFTPGPFLAAGWIATMLPTTVAAIDTVASHEGHWGSALPQRSLRILRAALAAWHGVAPADDETRALLETRVWYAPRPGLTEADLPEEVRAQLARVDELLAGKPASSDSSR